MSQAPNLLKASLGEGNLIFCCMGSGENYFESVSLQNCNNNNPEFQGWHI